MRRREPKARVLDLETATMTSSEALETAGPTGLLIGADLIFQSKITGTARELGLRVLVATGSAPALALLEQWRPRLVIVDLAGGELGSAPALLAYRTAAPSATFIAFGPHVDTRALDVARAAGCELVLPRSRFTAELPELLRRYLGGD